MTAPDKITQTHWRYHPEDMDQIGDAMEQVEYTRTAAIPALLAEARAEAADFVGKEAGSFPDSVAWCVEDLAKAILTRIDTPAPSQPPVHVVENESISMISHLQALDAVLAPPSVQEAVRFREVDEKITQEELQTVFGDVIPMHFAMILAGTTFAGPLECRKAVNRALAGEAKP